MVWGLMWYPYRALQQAGVSGQAATLITYFIALLLGILLLGAVWRELRVAGWWGVGLTLSAGWTNLGYVLAVLDGEVMRVLLLFYLAPLWTVILSRLLLGERLQLYGFVIMALSLGGACVMLWQPGTAAMLPQNTAEWIGLSAGFCFALTNVLVRRMQHVSVNFKSASVWFGTALLTAVLLLYRGELGSVLHGISAYAWLLLILLGLLVCATSFIVQYGLTLLPANQAIILFLSELVFAAISSYLLAHEVMGMREIVGAALIVSASLLSGKMQHSS